MIKSLCITDYNSLYDLLFNVKEINKPTQVFRSVIIKINKVLEQIDSRSRFIKYYNVVEVNETSIAVCKEELMDMKNPLKFLKSSKEFFNQKSKGKGLR